MFLMTRPTDSPEWEAKVEPLLTLGDSGTRAGRGSVARLWTFFRAEAARFTKTDSELRCVRFFWLYVFPIRNDHSEGLFRMGEVPLYGCALYKKRIRAAVSVGSGAHC
jgi:hypothetical protein